MSEAEIQQPSQATISTRLLFWTRRRLLRFWARRLYQPPTNQPTPMCVPIIALLIRKSCKSKLVQYLIEFNTRNSNSPLPPFLILESMFSSFTLFDFLQTDCRSLHVSNLQSKRLTQAFAPPVQRCRTRVVFLHHHSTQSLLQRREVT